MDNNTRRHPRTMQEAFGPYADNILHAKYEEPGWDWQDRLVTTACLVALIAVILIIGYWG